MAKFKIEITETLQRIVEVEAGSAEDATTKIATDYAKGKIVLDYTDVTNFSIKEFKED